MKRRRRVNVVLLDIEGTTTPISFVKERRASSSRMDLCKI